MFVAEESPNLRQKREVANRVKDLPRGNFMFFYHPDEWAMDHRGRLMPTVIHCSKDPGSGAVAANGDFTPAELEYRKRGWLPIPHETLGEVDYVAPYRNTKGKMVHRTIFQRGYNTAEGTTRWAFDQEAWDAFIALLRKRGLIKQPRPEVVSGLLEAAQEALRNIRAPRSDDGEKMERYLERVEVLKRQIAVLCDELGASYEAHGRPSSPGRSKVLALLEGLDDEMESDDPDVAAVLRATQPTLEASAVSAETPAEEPKPKRGRKRGGLVADEEGA